MIPHNSEQELAKHHGSMQVNLHIVQCDTGLIRRVCFLFVGWFLLVRKQLSSLAPRMLNGSNPRTSPTAGDH